MAPEEKQACSERSPEGEDMDLVRRVKGGDPQAFVLLSLKYHPQVFRVAYRALGCKEEAEDFTQEIFVTLYKCIRDLRQDQAFKTWLFRIVNRRCVDWLRRRRATPFADMGLAEDRLPSTGQDPCSAVIQKIHSYEVRRDVAEALLSLKPEERLVIIYHHFEGLRLEEIAEVMGLPYSRIRVHNRQGRRKLKSALRKYEPGS